MPNGKVVLAMEVPGDNLTMATTIVDQGHLEVKGNLDAVTGTCQV